MRAILQSTTAVLALVATSAMALAQSPMPWQPNLETAQRLAAQTNRLVLIHFWAPWCRPCMKLEQEVFSKAETAKGLEANFVLVKLNADEAPGTARLYGVSSLPSDVITLPNGRLVSQIQSPPSAMQYVQQMNQAAAGHRSLARKVTDNGAPAQPAAADPYGAPAPANAAPTAPVTTPVDGVAAAGAPVQPYAENIPAAQAAANGAANTAPATGQVTPAQAYSAVPAAAPEAQAPPLSDPYAHPPVAAPSAPPQAAPALPPNPYAATPTADPYAAPAAAPPTADPYAAAPYAAAPATPAPAAPPQAAPALPPNPYAAPAAPPAVAPYAAMPQQPAAAPPAVATTPYAAQPAFQPQVSAPQLPPGCPPVGLDGNCPVTLMERKRWAVGHPNFGAVHRGRTYLFLGPQERDKFLAEPDRYSPVLSGLDPVMLLESRQSVPGKREFGVFGADGKIYLFSDAATRDRFEQNEQHYSTTAAQMQQPTYQAMRQ
jgi:thiol-disulfide isomerase/thioredoxin/YHS domain-containing protein